MLITLFHVVVGPGNNASFETSMIVMVRLSLLLTTLLPLPVLGWNNSGHMITAIIAYQQMTEERRNAIVERLREHRRYRQDFEAQMPLDVPQTEKGMWIFARAAIWPDTARHFTYVGLGRDDLVLEFHNEHWHHARLPITFGPEESTLLDAGAEMQTQWPSGGSLTQMNALQALERAMQKQSEAIPTSEKAISLTWVLHLVGDIHQPLHSAALFNETVFPEGDQGGQRLLAFGRTLHDLWDSAAGSTATWPALKALANDLMFNYTPEAGAAVATTDPNVWNAESHALARSMAYTPAVLSAVTQYASPQSEIGIAVSEAYVSNMTVTAHKRIIQAGFRLARILEDLSFDSKERPDASGLSRGERVER
jgi:hypothetical protein